MSRHLAVAVCLAVVLAGCTGTPEPSASSSASPSPVATTPAPEPSPTEPSEPTPSPSPSPSATWAVPADWEPLDPAAAGVDTSSVSAVIGAWELPGGAVVSIVTAANDSGTTDPFAFYEDTFADFTASEDFQVTHAALATDAGEPVAVVTVTPTEEVGGDAQEFIVVLRPDSTTWATVSDSPGDLNDSGEVVWALMRALPSS